MGKIKQILAREVLDSRGNPTIEAIVKTSKCTGRAMVPSGASVGVYESVELRDKNSRYHGKGLKKALKSVKKIEKKLIGVKVSDQRKIDQTMIELDGTYNKKKLGANAILAVSLASARAASNVLDIDLYSYLNKLSGNKMRIPIPFANIINGGKHAGNKLNMQEFMVVPIGARNFSDATRYVSETYQILKQKIRKRYGKNAVNVGDEGGFAPPVAKAEEALNLISKAVESAGYTKQIKIAMDPAASEFYCHDGRYKLHKYFSAKDLGKYYAKLADRYDIISIEDPFEQNDFTAFTQFKSKKFQIVGDDLLVTNVERIKMALQKQLCNALLLKVNQVGTLSESLDSARLAMKSDWNVMVSHRSGETEDPFISDLAVSLGCGQIKLGAPCRGERTAKYNRLLRIEDETRIKYAKW